MKNLEHTWREKFSSMNEISTVSYWNRRAADYNNFIQTSRFGYGFDITGILLNEGFLQENMTVMEIASGVGALTIPLSRYVQSVKAIEPAIMMIQKLKENCRSLAVENIEVINGTSNPSVRTAI